MAAAAFAPIPGAPVLLLLLCALCATPAFGWEPASIVPSVGLSWARPLDTAVHDVYSGGGGVTGGLILPLPAPLRIELHGQWSRMSGSPDPLLAQSAGSRLTTSPWSLEFSVIPSRGRLRPFILAGSGLVILRERLTYALYGQEQSVTGKNVRFAGVAGAGIETRFAPYSLRLTARAYLTGGKREVLRPSYPALSDREASSASLFTLGLEVGREFPLHPTTGSR